MFNSLPHREFKEAPRNEQNNISTWRLLHSLEHFIKLINTMIGDFIMVLCGLQLTPALSYTSFNIVSIIYAIMFKKWNMMPIAFVNTLALHITFYATAFIIDPSFFNRLSLAYKYSKNWMVVGDMCVHVLPSICILLSLAFWHDEYIRIAQTNPQLIVFAPFYSLMLNTFWALLSDEHFVISRVYTTLSLKQWMCSWYICAFAHFSIGLFLAQRYFRYIR